MKVEHLLCVNGHNERIWCIAWSPTENIFATCSADRKVKIWRFIKEDSVGVSHFCPLDPQNCGKEYKVELEFSIDNAFKKTVRSVKFSNDGKFLICASFDGTTSIWTRTYIRDSTGESTQNPTSHTGCKLVWKYVSILQGHENEVKCAAFDPSGVYIATCGRDKTIWIYEKSRENVYGRGDLNTIEGSDSHMEYFCSAILSGHRHDVKYVCWNPSALLLASASYDNAVKLWTIKDNDWRCIQTLNLHSNTVWSLSFNFDGSLLASCSADKNLFIYESKVMKNFLDSNKIAKPQSLLWTVGPFSDPLTYKRSEASTYAPILADDWEIKRSYNELHSRPIYTLDFGDSILTGGGDNAIKIVKPDGKSEMLEINGHTSDVNSVAWKPFDDREIFASVGDDDCIRFWRLS
ncbi:WD domain, G-beta repeat containing protein [Theileria equi strain WA]|uniref:Probable cytosolic iron-sulfur protein assembly protein CIAO1 homolog n=1 Tax=Theileria equi strain WA TaxID=1537102 RepID=L1LDF1_THEEQ|nr:WD domain, G-beta repeat containing protein [Theileria equi strain WA]EKX73203.1 WD domain, G-beta repeat containing protein [Theileria equi strain WA]|eukprot:XP_004832655.1 WD domain, G-beta repeat containing protein [Theileria equi strain WA]